MATMSKRNAQRWRLVGLGVLMSAGSVFILLLGINDPGNGVLLDIAGAFTTLVFVPLTLFLIYAAVRLRAADTGSQSTMPLFSRKTNPELARTLTCMLFAGDGVWAINWMSDNARKEPPEFEAASLTDAVEQAATAALALWSPRQLVPGARLDFAIYPWRYGKNGAIYDISGGPGDFTARDIVGSNREVRAPSLEGLVEAVGHEPGGDAAMLRWVRPFAELPTDALDS
jgi:hypothetical protein